jgi:hypothetical protein
MLRAEMARKNMYIKVRVVRSTGVDVEYSDCRFMLSRFVAFPTCGKHRVYLEKAALAHLCRCWFPYMQASGMDDPNKRPRLGPGGFGGGSSYPHAGGPPPFRGGGNVSWC